MSSRQDVLWSLTRPNLGTLPLSQKLISAWQLIKGTMALSLVAHSIALLGSSFFQTNKIPLRIVLIGINFQQIVRRLSRRLGTIPTQFSTHIQDGRRIGNCPEKIIKSEWVSFMQWNSLSKRVFYQHGKHGDHMNFLCQINWNWFRATTTDLKEVLLAQDRSNWPTSQQL